MQALERIVHRQRQAGVAAILLLAILVMGSLYALLSGINTATAELQLKRDDATTAALKQAKDALIAWSAMHANGPGHLLCPDMDNDGQADTVSCGLATTRVGRLPWRTLGLPDLRDASGERLWYAVSRCFLERAPDGSCGNYAVNSDTQGQLRVGGVMQANGVVAIIFAPGASIARTAGGVQARSAVNINDVTHYLEGENANAPATEFEDMATSTDLFEIRRRCDQVDCPGGAFNDQLVTITHADLFNVVENVVAKRLETEIAPMLRFYRDRWAALGGSGFFPFAVPIVASPGPPGGSRDAFCGTPGTARGLLPVSQATSCLSFNPATTVVDNGTGNGSLGAATCADTPAGQPDPDRVMAVTCTITYTGNGLGAPNVSVSVTVQQAAMTLIVPIESGRITFGNALGVFTGGTGWGGITGQSLDASGNLLLTYGGALPNPTPGTPRTVTITFPAYSAQTRYQQTAGVDTSWFFDNEWYRDTYYAVVPQRLPGGAGACMAGVNCLTVLNAPGTNNDKQVVLVLAGRAINGAARPDWTLANYFEGENDEVAGPTLGTFVRQRRSATFNDKVVVVAP